MKSLLELLDKCMNLIMAVIISYFYILSYFILPYLICALFIYVVLVVTFKAFKLLRKTLKEKDNEREEDLRKKREEEAVEWGEMDLRALSECVETI